MRARGKYIVPENWVDYSGSVMLEPLRLYLRRFYGPMFDEEEVENVSDPDEEGVPAGDS